MFVFLRNEQKIQISRKRWCLLCKLMLIDSEDTSKMLAPACGEKLTEEILKQNAGLKLKIIEKAVDSKTKKE